MERCQGESPQVFGTVECDDNLLVVVAFHRFAILCQIHMIGTAVCGVEHLHIPIDRPHAFQIVKPDEVGALHDASAGEAEDAGMQVLEVFHQVGAQSMPVVAGHQTHVVEVDGLVALKEDAHEAFLHRAVRLQRATELLSLVTTYRDGLSGNNIVLVVNEFHAYLSLFAVEQVQTPRRPMVRARFRLASPQPMSMCCRTERRQHQ